MRNPLDGQTCVCANEQCQRGTLVAPPRAAGVPLCVNLAPLPASSLQHAHHPGLARHTNTGLCECAPDHCALRPPVGSSAGEANAALTCVPLAAHPEFRRDDGGDSDAAGGSRGTCACAVGYCRRLGKHSEQCVREGDMYVRSGDGENGDHCVCTESHCDRGFDFESGRVCLSLAANPMLRRRSSDQRGLTVGAVPFALTPYGK